MSVQCDYSQHGDPAIRSLLLYFLSQVSGCGQYRLGVGGVSYCHFFNLLLGMALRD